jgi:hypothetical protein
MLDVSSAQHLQTTAIIHRTHLDKSSASSSDKHNMADFLNAFEAFLSGGGDTASSPAEADEESMSSEAAEADVAATAYTSPPASISPPLNVTLLPGSVVKMPPDKPLTPPASSHSPQSSPPSVEVKRDSSSPPSVLLEVPSSGPNSGASCDRTAAASDVSVKTGSGSGGIAQGTPLPVSKPIVPPIKPIVPPIKLRKVDSSNLLCTHSFYDLNKILIKCLPYKFCDAR